MMDIIEQRRKDPKEYDDLLQMLMEAKDEETGEQMSDRQLRDECMTIFLAGHETTALALTWLWYLLDQNPAEIDKLRAEANEVLQGRNPDMGDVMKLEYTRMALEETMRLYPPAWVIGRRNIADEVIGGYHVPANYNILIPVYQMHRDPDIWEDPLRFDPERFRKGQLKDKHRFAYFPFGGGPRLCIGNNFALMEMQIVVAMMVTRFRFKLVPSHPVVLDPLVTLRAKHGMKMTVE
jgi:cytochrome P450